MPRCILLCFFGLAPMAWAGTSARAQVLETETARLLPARMLEVGSAYEYQTSAEGFESAVPFLIEYGIFGALELAVEPVVGTRIRPTQGPQATGPGDLEATMTYRFHQEVGWVPAFAIAGEVKFPTATNSLIGTGATDYTAYLIASKRFGRLDTSYNVGYTLVGQPPGAALNNILSFAVAGVIETGKRTRVFGEVLGNTISAPGGIAESGTTPEAAGGELVGTVGFVYLSQPRMQLFLGVSYDNSNATLLRSGFTLEVE